MALDGTYTGLKASVADWLNRQDLTAQVADFITMAEAQFNRELRVINMETMDSGSTADGIITVPSDWLETRTLRLAAPNAGQQLLEYVGEEEWDALQASGLSNTIRYYTIINNAFQILPTPTASVDYILRYYAQIPALATNASNWLLTKSPDVYIYSSCLQAAPFLKDDDRVAVWGAVRAKIIQDIQYESERAKRSTTRLRTVKSTYG